MRVCLRTKSNMSMNQLLQAFFRAFCGLDLRLRECRPQTTQRRTRVRLFIRYRWQAPGAHALNLRFAIEKSSLQINGLQHTPTDIANHRWPAKSNLTLNSLKVTSTGHMDLPRPPAANRSNKRRAAQRSFSKQDARYRKRRPSESVARWHWACMLPSPSGQLARLACKWPRTPSAAGQHER